ncbi:hypothetical protein LNA02_16710 [Levilactobacillus namurensis]|nr:hypothetical protein LNA02_16710 [Levilactobacillus namurensis]
MKSKKLPFRITQKGSGKTRPMTLFIGKKSFGPQFAYSPEFTAPGRDLPTLSWHYIGNFINLTDVECYLL